jgi:hypothetical protein
LLERPLLLVTALTLKPGEPPGDLNEYLLGCRRDTRQGIRMEKSADAGDYFISI